MSPTMLPLPPAWPEDVMEALILEAAGLPAPKPGKPAPELPHAELAGACDRFAPSLRAARIRTRQGEYIAVWLEEEVEAAVDEAWGARPELGFWLHAVARSLCLAAVRQLAPAAVASGCAPVPGPDPELAAALRLAGLDCADADERRTALLLGRRYAVVTCPVAGGCGTCALAAECPRRGDSAEFDLG